MWLRFGICRVSGKHNWHLSLPLFPITSSIINLLILNYRNWIISKQARTLNFIWWLLILRIELLAWTNRALRFIFVVHLFKNHRMKICLNEFMNKTRRIYFLNVECRKWNYRQWFRKVFNQKTGKAVFGLIDNELDIFDDKIMWSTENCGPQSYKFIFKNPWLL